MYGRDHRLGRGSFPSGARKVMGRFSWVVAAGVGLLAGGCALPSVECRPSLITFNRTAEYLCITNGTGHPIAVDIFKGEKRPKLESYRVREDFMEDSVVMCPFYYWVRWLACSTALRAYLDSSVELVVFGKDLDNYTCTVEPSPAMEMVGDFLIRRHYVMGVPDCLSRE